MQMTSVKTQRKLHESNRLANLPAEKERINNLISLLPLGIGNSVLDVGASDGFISRILAEYFPVVVALDLEQPSIQHERIRCVKGDVTALDFPDASFDLVFCAEVIEHISPPKLRTACSELARVSSEYVLIGVPFKQDIRVGRSTCSNCGRVNPSWGHLNTFDEIRLAELFPGFAIQSSSFVGQTNERTNWLASALMDLAGNPYGTYSQLEPCVDCGAAVGTPMKRNLWQKVLTKVAFSGMRAHQALSSPHPNWIHQLLRRTVG